MVERKIETEISQYSLVKSVFLSLAHISPYAQLQNTFFQYIEKTKGKSLLENSS